MGVRRLEKQRIASPAHLWEEIREEASRAILRGPEGTWFATAGAAASTLAWLETAFVAVEEYENGQHDETGEEIPESANPYFYGG